MQALVDAKLTLPAYDQCIKASHCFNLLDARGVISVTERAAYIGRVRALGESLLRKLACFPDGRLQAEVWVMDYSITPPCNRRSLSSPVYGGGAERALASEAEGAGATSPPSTASRSPSP